MALPHYPDGGTSPGGLTTGTKPATTGANFENHVSGKLLNRVQGKKYITEVYPTETRLVDAATGQVLQTVSRYNQYGSPAVQQILKEKGQAVRYTNQDFSNFGTQHRQASTDGTYTSSAENKFDWNDLKERHGDWIGSEYTGGYDKFIQDIQDKSQSGAATKWFQGKVNEKVSADFGKDKYYFRNAEGSKDPATAYDLDGKFGQFTFSVPRFFAEPKAPEPPKPEPTPLPAPLEPEPDVAKQKGWWLQDIANFSATLTDPVNKYNPMLQQVDLQSPDYTLLDPTRQLASLKEQEARFADLTMNTSDGQVARANMLGAAGESAARAADVIGQYENSNVQIVNQAQAAAAQSHNLETQTNAKLADEYVSRLATANQQYDNAVKQRKYDRLNAFTNGVTNSMKQRQMEEVLFPGIEVDRMNGHVTIDPKRAYDNREAETAGMGSYGSDSATSAMQYAATAREQALTAGFSAEDAADIAKDAAKNVWKQQQQIQQLGLRPGKNGNRLSPAQLQEYKRAMLQGMGGLPSPAQIGPDID